MIHVYRDPTAREVRFRALFGLFLFFLIFLALILLPLASGEDRFAWDTAAPVAMVAGLVLLLGYAVYRRERYQGCREIRLDDHAICELETTDGRVIRLHVNEIRSVQYSRDSESDSESYTIRYQGGKLVVAERMTDFLDFLTRLKALNPAVDLTTFPPRSWPGLGGRPTEEPGPLRRFVQSALFPAIVIVVIVYTAGHTLLDK